MVEVVYEAGAVFGVEEVVWGGCGGWYGRVSYDYAR
jgi:hypothetical protein